MQRYPFELAVLDDNLLGKRWKELSTPQRTILKAYYGLELTPAELDFWAVSQGSVVSDDLGYPVQITPIEYFPKEYNELWATIGRRSGKTDTLMGTTFVYEACLGGHEEYGRPGQPLFIFNISQKLEVAVQNMAFVRETLHSSEILKSMIVADTADGIRLDNGITIAPSPPSIKQRGFGAPVVGMDEVGFWYTDSTAANPDKEVVRAVSFAQMQFPNWKRFAISSPGPKEGLLYENHQAGTEGRHLPADKRDKYEGVLVVQASTASMQNPRISRRALAQIRQADPDGFARESLAQFQDSISGFLSRALLEQAVQTGVYERPPVAADAPIRPRYVAAMDPAFRKDSWGFAIAHMSLADGVVFDVVRRFTPTHGQKLNPKAVLTEIIQLLRAYGITTLYSDQFQLESLQQIAQELGITIHGVDFTQRSKAKIWGNFQQLLNQGKVKLLDPLGGPAQQAMLNELATIEKHITAMNNVQIAAPRGKHDDMATVAALTGYQAIWMPPAVEVEDLHEKPPTPFQLCQATIAKHKESATTGNGDTWD